MLVEIEDWVSLMDIIDDACEGCEDDTWLLM